MAWKHIQRNLAAHSILALVGNTKTSSADKLYALVDAGASTTVKFYRLTGAQGSPAAIWDNTSPALPNITDPALFGTPKSARIDVSGFAYNPDMNQIYIVNSKRGNVYIWNDTSNIWQKAWSGSAVGSTSWNGYTGESARLRQILYSNGFLYLAHRGGVSSLNTRISGSAWTLAAEFASPQYGPGDCTGLAVYNNELYVTVENYNAVYKNNNTLAWDKVAVFPDYSVNPRYLAPSSTYARGLLVTADDINTNFYRTDKIETATTPEPTFEDGIHLTSPATSILTSRIDGITWVTTGSGSHASETVNMMGQNLATAFADFPIINKGPEDTGEILTSAFSVTSPVGGTERLAGTSDTMTATAVNTDSKAEKDPTGFTFARKGLYVRLKNYQRHEADVLKPRLYTSSYVSDPMTLLPDILYGFKFGAVGKCTRRVAHPLINGNAAFSVYKGARFEVEVGLVNGDDVNQFAPEVLTKKFNFSSDTASTIETFINQQSGANIYEFMVNALRQRSNVRLRITISVGVPDHYPYYPFSDWYFDMSLGSFSMVRPGGTAVLGQISFSPQYIVQNLAQVPAEDVSKYLITSPSPPNEWFIKFKAPSRTDVTDFKYSEVIRRITMNPVNLNPNTVYKFQINILRDAALNSSVPLRFSVTTGIQSFPTFYGTLDTLGHYPITWEINTASLSADKLKNVVFTLTAFEENITLGEAAPVFFSDILLSEVITDSLSMAIYRFTANGYETTASTQAVRADNTQVTLTAANNLIETYETASEQYRTYLLSNGTAYVWEINPNDPFGVSRLAQIIISW